MSASSKTVGIIGLGIMGGAIAKNLAAAGWQVIGFDIAKDKCDEAKAAGVEIAKDAAAVAAKVTNILVSLPKPEALTATALPASRAPACGPAFAPAVRDPAESASARRSHEA